MKISILILVGLFCLARPISCFAGASPEIAEALKALELTVNQVPPHPDHSLTSRYTDMALEDAWLSLAVAHGTCHQAPPSRRDLLLRDISKGIHDLLLRGTNTNYSLRSFYWYVLDMGNEHLKGALAGHPPAHHEVSPEVEIPK